jgi:hypothetical protein
MHCGEDYLRPWIARLWLWMHKQIKKLKLASKLLPESHLYPKVSDPTTEQSIAELRTLERSQRPRFLHAVSTSISTTGVAFHGRPV